MLEQSDGATWSDNFQLALITGWVSEEFPNGREWLYDRETGTLTDVKDLGGVGADVAAFADDETHYLLCISFKKKRPCGRFFLFQLRHSHPVLPLAVAAGAEGFYVAAAL